MSYQREKKKKRAYAPIHGFRTELRHCSEGSDGSVGKEAMKGKVLSASSAYSQARRKNSPSSSGSAGSEAARAKTKHRPCAAQFSFAAALRPLREIQFALKIHF
jgi:hypothetical protein